MPNFTIQADEDEYRLCVDGEEGSMGAYGLSPSACKVGNDIYYCFVDNGDQAEEAKVCRVDSVTQFHVDLVEEAQFTDKDEPEPDEPDEDEEEEDELEPGEEVEVTEE